MAIKAARRIPATEVKTHFGRIVQEVATTGTPVIIQTRGDDQAAIISLRDFKRLWPLEAARPVPERERVRAALRAAGLLSEPTPEMRRRAAEYDARHPPGEQEQILAELRSLHLDPPLSQIILESRTWRLGSEWVAEE
jgi:prevent-host-death family protein